ncbi:hypothetical protein Patl1_00074 [Pistacia atlantica]|uniref:Uncharacterized protein n=1 Tax=Pistacia atlantica TaxID=434234 RepID=A0ACC1CDE7_9ROSI|nr:hypothetical protein Patl1_00074 [Pistacia atlantica]
MSGSSMLLILLLLSRSSTLYMMEISCNRSNKTKSQFPLEKDRTHINRPEKKRLRYRRLHRGITKQNMKTKLICLNHHL